MHRPGLLILFLIGGCVDGGRVSMPPPTDGIDERATVALPTLEQGCGWFEVFLHQGTHYALSDTAARYWVALGPSNPAPETRLRISGEYPDARYFSFHVYDRQLQSQDALADYEIPPSGIQANPYRDTVRVNRPLLGFPSYAATLEFAAKPAQPAAGTLYFDATRTPDSSSLVLLRSYAPVTTPLPRLTLQTPQGDLVPPSPATDVACATEMARLQAVYLTPPAPEPPSSSADRVPYMRVFRGTDSSGEGLLINRHNAYLYALTELQPGRAVVLRARAPTWTDDARLLSLLIAPELRFWSVCQYSLQQMPVPGCISDFQAKLDNTGFFTVVISDPLDRPERFLARHDVNWLPWGDDPRGFPTYRHLLPNPDFEQAIQNVTTGEAAATVMQEYYPRIRYCSTALLDSLSNSSGEEVLQACASEFTP